MQLGEFELHTVNGGRYWIDGGTMFGVVPKALWERNFPTDERNRIRQATNCVLVRTGSQNILIDTGHGPKLSDKQREQISAEPGEPLLDDLARLGVTPEQIDRVILSHLHFDHAGGTSRIDQQGQAQLVFPRAEYVVQRREWVTACGDFPEFRGAYPLENLTPLRDSGRLRLIDGNVEIIDGIRVIVTGGHTDGHQVIVIESGGDGAIYLSDICPTWRHLPVLWCLGYDAHMAQTRRAKADLLGHIADRGWWALFDHDPDVAAAKLRRDSRKDFSPTEQQACL